MRKHILMTGAAVFFVGSSALASAPSNDTVRPQVSQVSAAGVLLARNDNEDKDDKKKCKVVSPSKPCKGNNGFGNGGNDGSPNGFPDDNR
jgi:hypothetical protein